MHRLRLTEGDQILNGTGTSVSTRVAAENGGSPSGFVVPCQSPDVGPNQGMSMTVVCAPISP